MNYVFLCYTANWTLDFWKKCTRYKFLLFYYILLEKSVHFKSELTAKYSILLFWRLINYADWTILWVFLSVPSTLTWPLKKSLKFMKITIWKIVKCRECDFQVSVLASERKITFFFRKLTSATGSERSSTSTEQLDFMNTRECLATLRGFMTMMVNAHKRARARFHEYL